MTSLASANQLALHGGAPVYAGPWPRWPQHGPRALDLLRDVLESGRWAISGTWSGTPTCEREFARRWAEYVGVRFCTPVDHGSSALVAALLALGIGDGDEVIVPGLTWVACASAVVRAGATPVLVDIDAESLCIDPHAVEAALTPRTRAILAVHLYSAMCDMDALRAIADRHALAIVEDAAQAHGAMWNGRRAGSLGHVGTFSMQQGKTLTSGEGGAAVTDDESLHARIEQIRADGRMFGRETPPAGHPELEEIGAVQGFNFCLSEVQAALLLDGLERLDAQNATRAANASRLTAALQSFPALLPVKPYAPNTHRAYYHYAIRLTGDAFAGKPVDAVCGALEAELGTWVHAPYAPLDAHPLYPAREQPRFALPRAHHAARRTILFHHSTLLGGQRELDAIVTALAKVQAGARRL